jgi:ATP-dependent Clp protease ATP-binding subunit ClpA
MKLSFLLFDEIEKASDALWQLLLGILDKGTLTLGDNRRVNLAQSIIFMTSNLGGSEITELVSGHGRGFTPALQTDERTDQKVTGMAVEAAKRNFAPEFMNRIDKLIVFHPLRDLELDKILDIELALVQRRILETSRRRFTFRVSSDARRFLLREGTDLKYGARHLKRSIERYLVFPLASLLSSGQIAMFDAISIERDEKHNELIFLLDQEEAQAPALPSMPPVSLEKNLHWSGRTVSPFPTGMTQVGLESRRDPLPSTQWRSFDRKP